MEGQDDASYRNIIIIIIIIIQLLFSYYSTSLNILNGYSFNVVVFIKIIVQLSRSKILLGYGNLQDNLD